MTFQPSRLALTVWALLALAMASCAGDPGLECGPGTHREADRCVADDPPSDGGLPLDGALPPDSAAPDTGSCITCTAEERRCDAGTILACVSLTDGCSAWTVETTCSFFEQCDDATLACVVPVVEPPSFPVDVADASWGITPESMLWDGMAGVVTFSYAMGGGLRVLGVVRFNATGPLGAVNLTGFDDQASSLASAGGRDFVHWNGSSSPSGGPSTVAEVLPNATLGPTVDGTNGENVYAFGVDTGLLLTKRYGSATAFGFFSTATRSITWYPTRSRRHWAMPTAIGTATATGFTVAWFELDVDAIGMQHFDASGVAISTATSTPVVLPESDSYMLDLTTEADGALLLWGGAYRATSNYDLHLSRLDADGSLVSDLQITGDGYIFKRTRLVGHLDESILVSFHPDMDGASTAIARIDRLGNVLDARLLSHHQGIARYAAGTLAHCWGVSEMGIRCAVVPYP